MPAPKHPRGGNDSHFILFYGVPASAGIGSGPPADTSPDAFSFNDVVGAELSTVYESNAIVVAGISGPSPMTVTGGQYQKNGGVWASVATTVMLGDSVKVRGTSSHLNETAVDVILNIGGFSDTFRITTEEVASLGPPINVIAPVVSGFEQVGQTLAVFSGTWTGEPVITFTYQWMVETGTGAPVNIVVPAITGTEDIGQTLSVTTGNWTGTPVITYTYQWYIAVQDGGDIVMEGSDMAGDPIPGATSPTYVVEAEYTGERIFCEVTGTNAEGNSSAQSNVTGAIGAAADTVPNAFSFTDVTGVDPSTLTESNAIVVAGMTAAAPMTITGGEYQKNGGAWASTATTTIVGDSIKVRATSSATELTAVNVQLTIGGVSDTFTITTKAWDPSYLGANLLLWTRVDQEVYSDAGVTPIADGQTVRQWNDISGNDNHWVQATGGSRPPYGDDIFNGSPGIQMGNPAFMETSIGFGTTTLSCFFIGQPVILNANGRIISYQAIADGNDFGATTSGIILMGKTVASVHAYRNGNKSEGAVTANPVRIGSVFNGSTHTLYVDGVAQTPVASTGTFSATGTLALGASPGGSSFIDTILVSEIIITNSVLSAPNLALMDAYLEAQWEGYAAPQITTHPIQFNAEGTVLGVPLTAETSFGETVTWSLVGVDAARFEINGGDFLRWLANGVKDFGAPDDAGANNVYNVTIRATGGTTGLVSDLPLTVPVLNMDAGAARDIIWDTDYGADADDAGALGIAIKRHLDGDINLLGVVCSSGIEASAPAVRATLDHYGLTAVPVGAYHGTATGIDVYAEEVRDTFGDPEETKDDYMDDVTLVRMILARATRDLTYVSVGGLGSMSRVLNSAADDISASDGETLVTSRIELAVIMAGDFPTSSSPEYNMQRDIPASQDIADNWPTPVTWHGADLGAMGNAGPPTVDPDTDPIRKAYFVMGSDTRAMWDPLATLHACDGDGTLFAIDGADGTTTVDGSGNNDWDVAAGNDSYAELVGDPSLHEAAINGILADLITP